MLLLLTRKPSQSRRRNSKPQPPRKPDGLEIRVSAPINPEIIRLQQIHHLERRMFL